MASEGSKVSRLKISDLVTVRDGAVPNKDARLTNCFIEDVNGTPQVLKRGGFGFTQSMGTGQGHGATVYTNSTSGMQKVYCVTGSSVYHILGGTNTSAVINGTFAVSTNELVDWMQYYYGTAQPNLVLKCSSAGYGINTNTDAVTKITDGNYPSITARGLVFLDGTFYVMDRDGTIYGSNSNDVFTWSALNKISAAIEPDGGVALAKSGQYVVAFGNYTTEYFYDAGNPTGSPLSPVQNGALMIGCAQANSIAYGEGSFYMLAQAKAQGQAAGYSYQVGKITDLRYEKVSNDTIERILNADGASVCFGSVISLLAHSFYLIALPASNLTLAMEIETKRWYVFTTMVVGVQQGVVSLTRAVNIDLITSTVTAFVYFHGFSDGDVVTITGASQSEYNITTNITYVDQNTFTYQISTQPVTPATGTIIATGYTQSYYPLIFAAQYGNTQVAQRVTDGYICTTSDTSYTDFGTGTTVYIDSHMRTSRIDNEKNQQKFLAWMDLVTDRTDNNALIRYTDNDYQSFSKYRKVSLSGKRSRLNRQGKFIRRAFEIRVTDNNAFRMQGLDLGLEEGIE